MTDYTEAQIHTLDGADLNAAVCQIVLGDDLTANTDERIDRALQTLEPQCRENYFWRRRPVRSNFWHERQGQPWQADLESHVAAYRAKPWEQKRMDLNWCIPELMGPGKVLAGWTCGYEPVYEDWICIQVEDGDAVYHPTDQATAIKRAACIVALRLRGEA